MQGCRDYRQSVTNGTNGLRVLPSLMNCALLRSHDANHNYGQIVGIAT